MSFVRSPLSGSEADNNLVQAIALEKQLHANVNNDITFMTIYKQLEEKKSKLTKEQLEAFHQATAPKVEEKVQGIPGCFK